MQISGGLDTQQIVMFTNRDIQGIVVAKVNM